MSAGFGADVDALFQAAAATLFDQTLDVTRKGTPVNTGVAFNSTRAVTTIASNVPCSIQHATIGTGNSYTQYAARLNGRSLAFAFVPRSTPVLDHDTLVVHGGDTYDVVGQPHLDGPDDPALTVPCAAITPAVVNA